MIAEMPPGYRNRVAEIQRLIADVQEMSRFGRLLTETGASLTALVRDAFVAMNFEVETLAAPAGCLALRVDGGGRLLVYVSGEQVIVPKKHPEIAGLFQLLHEVADPQDHVVFVTNTEGDRAPALRGEALAPDALTFVARLGVSHVTAASLFALWKLSLQEPGRARDQITRLHGHPGGSLQLG